MLYYKHLLGTRLFELHKSKFRLSLVNLCILVKITSFHIVSPVIPFSYELSISFHSVLPETALVGGPLGLEGGSFYTFSLVVGDTRFFHVESKSFELVKNAIEVSIIERGRKHRSTVSMGSVLVSGFSFGGRQAVW